MSKRRRLVDLAAGMLGCTLVDHRQMSDIRRAERLLAGSRAQGGGYLDSGVLVAHGFLAEGLGRPLPVPLREPEAPGGSLRRPDRPPGVDPPINDGDQTQHSPDTPEQVSNCWSCRHDWHGSCEIMHRRPDVRAWVPEIDTNLMPPPDHGGCPGFEPEA